jgi:hypothetical protein
LFCEVLRNSDDFEREPEEDERPSWMDGQRRSPRKDVDA